jgi:hypothetical protein
MADNNVISMNNGQQSYGKSITARQAIYFIRTLWRALHQPNPDKDWLIKLLTHSFSITFSKETLQKILEQEDCAGIRFYFCLRNKEPYEKTSQSQVLSTVLVGVDKNGTDLKYEYDPSKHLWNPDENTWASTPDIETVTACYEYGSSSGPSSGHHSDKELEPYVLFRYATPPKEK